MLSINDLRVNLRIAKTRAERLLMAPDRRARRQHARILQSTLVDQLSDKSSFALSETGFVPWPLEPLHADALVESWQALEVPSHAAAAPRRPPQATGKAFFRECLSDEDIATNPVFIMTALNEGVLIAVMQTLGLVPHLESVDILISSPSTQPVSASQLWHYDVNDERIIKLFVYLEDCGPENGPFTYIRADQSMRVARRVGHYVNDEAIAVHISPSDWEKVEGKAGTAFLIDTGRCYHFGSRCEKRRVAFIATYSSGLKFMRRAKMWGSFAQSFSLSPLQRAVCGIGA